jgi:hypothetical protein
MSPETIRALATEIVNQTILNNWLFYVVLACITVLLAAGGAFLSSYFAKRAEIAAQAASFGELKRQLEETTALSESIKVDIKQLAERSEKLQWLKREKLEDYVVAILRGVEHLSKEMLHRFFDAEAPTEEDPLLIASMLQKLYLPELDGQHALFLKTVGEFRGWVATGMQQRLDALKATNVKSAPNKDITDQYVGILEKVHASVLVIEKSAKELARELNKV